MEENEVIISKELLSELYNFKVKDFVKLGVDEVTYEVRFEGLKNGLKYEIINIHDLANKFKKWVRTLDYKIQSGCDGKWYCMIDKKELEEIMIFEDTDEPKSVFKACEWIYMELQEGKL